MTGERTAQPSERDLRPFLMLAVAVISPANAAVARFLFPFLSTFGVILLRSAAAVAILAAIALFARRSLATPCIGHQALRAFFGTSSLALWYFSLTGISLADSMALLYTSPLFLAAGAVIGSLRRGRPVPWKPVLLTAVYLNLLNLPPAQIRNLFVLRPVSQARFRISQAPNGNFISNSAFFSAAFSSGSAFAGST